MTDLLNEVQQVKIMGGEQSNSELKIYLGHCRTYYKNPDYIFLDEATNWLDANNERSIVENLNKFYKGKTVMIVAHRLSTKYGEECRPNCGHRPCYGIFRKISYLCPRIEAFFGY